MVPAWPVKKPGRILLMRGLMLSGKRHRLRRRLISRPAGSPDMADQQTLFHLPPPVPEVLKIVQKIADHRTVLVVRELETTFIAQHMAPAGRSLFFPADHLKQANSDQMPKKRASYRPFKGLSEGGLALEGLEIGPSGGF